MSTAYTRPFHPLDLASRMAAVFPLSELTEQLRQEEVYRTAHRNALTLIHDEDLTVVLTVASEGTECENHLSQEPTVFVVMDGDLAIESVSGRDIINLPHGSAGALARDIRHRLIATTDCAYLLVMGCTSKTGKAAKSRPAIGDDASSAEQSVRSSGQTPSAEGEPGDVEDLVHRLIETIETAPVEKRDEMRAYVTDLLAAEISSERSNAEEVESTRRRAPLSLAAVALSLAVVGLGFLFLLPPVAVVLLLLSLLTGAGAVVQMLAVQGFRMGERLLRLRPRTIRREREERLDHSRPFTAR